MHFILSILVTTMYNIASRLTQEPGQTVVVALIDDMTSLVLAINFRELP